MSSPVVQVQYRQLGKSGLRVSVPILGGGSYGSKNSPLLWVLDPEEALTVIKAAWDRGINTIDTANVYSNGESERVIAQFIEKYSIPRNEIIIATKCHGIVGKDVSFNTFAPGVANTRDYVNQGGLSRAAIFNAVEASLARLKTTYIDLYQIHRYDPSTPAEETMKALHDLVQWGKVRYIGGSSMRAWQFAHLNEVARAHGWTTFVSMQDEYSLIYREEEREMIPYCEFHGIGIIPWSPLAAGELSRPLATPESQRNKIMRDMKFMPALSESAQAIIKRVEELASKYHVGMSQIALAWIFPKIVSPIVGITSVERLEETVTAADVVLTKEDIEYLEGPYVPQPVRWHS